MYRLFLCCVFAFSVGGLVGIAVDYADPKHDRYSLVRTYEDGSMWTEDYNLTMEDCAPQADAPRLRCIRQKNELHGAGPVTLVE